MSGYVKYLREVDFNSRLPKYRQVILAITRDVRKAILRPGDKIPSINEASSECYLSRDTVEKAYKELSRRGIIRSVPGKGFFVSETVFDNPLKILLVFDRLDDSRWKLYHALNQCLEGAELTMMSYEHNYRMLTLSLQEHQDDFDFFIVIPHFFAYQDDLRKAFEAVTPERLIVLTHAVDGLDDQTSQFTFDRRVAWEQALKKVEERFSHYKRMVLYFPEDFSFPQEILEAVEAFCESAQLPLKVQQEWDQRKVQTGDVCLVLEDETLSSLLEVMGERGLEPGKDIGIVSFDDNPLKEALAGGISTLGYDYHEIAQLTATRIETGNPLSHHFPLQWTIRKSL